MTRKHRLDRSSSDTESSMRNVPRCHVSTDRYIPKYRSRSPLSPSRSRAKRAVPEHHKPANPTATSGSRESWAQRVLAGGGLKKEPPDGRLSPVVYTPTKTANASSPAITKTPNKSHHIPLARDDDELVHLNLFFASCSGHPCFNTLFKQPNARDTFVGNKLHPGTKDLERYFPRLRFRATGRNRELSVWVELSHSKKKEGFVLSQIDRKMLGIAHEMLQTYSLVNDKELPDLKVFIEQYFDGLYD